MEAASKMEWSEERIAGLRKMWLEGFSASQVARQLGGVSRNAVIGKVHRMGLAGRATPSRPRCVRGRPPSRAKARLKHALAQASAKRSVALAALAPIPFDVEAGATILTLGERACRWPIGEPDAVDFGFCGRACQGHGSYCDGHALIAFRAKGRPPPRASDVRR